MLQQIEISKLYPHPDNPRKDVGDVTELAESIKQNGIYQNLTVVAGGKGVPEGEEGYTVIIGHRRRAAALQAGLESLPCVVAEMSEVLQVETMLLENMQRTDLTIYEQAKGFQMLLDLGETQQSIAEKTGFSPATVSRRVKLLQIKSAAFEKSQNRQISMEDYLRIADLKSKSAQKEALEAAGTNNFNWTMKRLLEEQLKNEVLPKIEKELKELGAVKLKEAWSGAYSYLKDIDFANYTPGCMNKGIKQVKELFYYVFSNSVRIYKKNEKVAAQKTVKSDEEKAADRARRQLKTVSDEAYALRRDFIVSFGASVKFADIINEWAVKAIAHAAADYNNAFNREECKEIIGQETGYYVDAALITKFMEEQPSRAAAVIVWCALGDCKARTYYEPNYYTHMPSHKKNSALDRTYAFLCDIGYEMSDEEITLQNGTHPLFNTAGDSE